MRKSRIVFALLSAAILLVCGYQYSYEMTLQNSDFLKWCHTLTDDIWFAWISVGDPPEDLDYELSNDEIQELVGILNGLTAEDLYLSKDYPYASRENLNLMVVVDHDLECDFVYLPEAPEELYIRFTGQDTFGRYRYLKTTNQNLLAFILSHEPTQY